MMMPAPRLTNNIIRDEFIIIRTLVDTPNKDGTTTVGYTLTIHTKDGKCILEIKNYSSADEKIYHLDHNLIYNLLDE